MVEQYPLLRYKFT